MGGLPYNKNFETENLLCLELAWAYQTRKPTFFKDSLALTCAEEGDIGEVVVYLLVPDWPRRIWEDMKDSIPKVEKSIKLADRHR